MCIRDRFSSALSVFTQAVPGFIVAILIIYFFGVKLKAVKFFTGDGKFSVFTVIVIMAFYRIGPWARVVRNAFREEMNKSYVRFSISRGIPKNKVLFFHAYKPVLCCLVSAVMSDFAVVFGASSVLEFAFTIPGLSYFLVRCMPVSYTHLDVYKRQLGGYTNIPIMSYAVKYASAFYGPFRDAAGSAPAFGDRKSYQMDFHNRREGMKEALMDIEEGADIIMVKPAMSYLDMVSEISKAVNVPVAAYSVSGEYAMVKAAAKMGWIDEERIIGEMAVGAYRAGAQIYITYFAEEIAKMMEEGRIG